MTAANGSARIQTAGNFATRGVPSLDDMTLSPTASSPGNINSTFSLNGSGSGARPIDMLVDTAKAAYNDPLRAAKNVFLGVAQGGIGFVGDAVRGYAMMGDLAFNGGQNIGTIDRFSVRPFAYDADMGLLGVAGEFASPAAYVKLAQLGGQGLRVAAPVAQEMWATAGEKLLAPRTMNPQFGGVLVGDGVGVSSEEAAANVKGIYRGGSHGDTRLPVGDGFDSHHMPNRGADSRVSPRDGPAIQMDPLDHAKTSSNGQNGRAGAIYRAENEDMIGQGRYRDTMAREVWDVRKAALEGSGSSSKYNQATREMLDYARSSGQVPINPRTRR